MYTSPSSQTKKDVFWGVRKCRVVKEGPEGGGGKNKLGIL
jgi:hypothetical protein